jgi:hypothetical protein
VKTTCRTCRVTGGLREERRGRGAVGRHPVDAHGVGRPHQAVHQPHHRVREHRQRLIRPHDQVSLSHCKQPPPSRSACITAPSWGGVKGRPVSGVGEGPRARTCMSRRSRRRRLGRRAIPRSSTFHMAGLVPKYVACTRKGSTQTLSPEGGSGHLANSYGVGPCLIQPPDTGIQRGAGGDVIHDSKSWRPDRSPPLARLAL